MTNYPYPGGMLPPRSVMADIVPATTGGGRGITAVEQVISYDAGYWQIDLNEIPVASRGQKLAWRGLSANCDGRLGVIDVPTYPISVAPYALDADGKPITYLGGLFTDRTVFSDGTPFSDGLIVSTMVNDADMGDTQVTIFIEASAQDLVAGMDFSAQGATRQRLYRVKTVGAKTPVTGGYHYVLTITPPLREDIDAGAVLNWGNPICSCRLLDDTQMRSAVDDYAGRGLGKIVWVEAVN